MTMTATNARPSTPILPLWTSHLARQLEARSSPKDGRGVFARERVEKGEPVVVFGGDVVSYDQVLALPPALRRVVMQVEEGLYLLTSREGPADWVNHSCEPNAGLSGQITLVALRAIKPGEEVCFDYAMTDGSAYDAFDCRCGTPRCRTRVTGEDWRDERLQRRYRGYFSPYLERRIRTLRLATTGNGEDS